MRESKYLVYLFSAASHSLFVRLDVFDVGVKFISRDMFAAVPCLRRAKQA